MSVAPPTVADERATLEGFLDQARAAVRRKCEGLAATDWAEGDCASEMTPARIVADLRCLEARWFEGALRGEKIFDSVPGARLGQLLDEYDEQCRRSREICRTLSLDTAVYDEGIRFSVRWILFHVLAETARQAGCLDAVLDRLTAA